MKPLSRQSAGPSGVAQMPQVLPYGPHWVAFEGFDCPVPQQPHRGAVSLSGDLAAQANASNTDIRLKF
jgi:hypothetical protein